MPSTTSSWIRIVPEVDASVVRISTTPLHANNPANVTTNDGTFAFVMINPCSSPIAVVTRRPAPIAAHHGQCDASGRSNRHITTAPTPLTNATDRSISAIRSTKTVPMAIVVYPDIWRSRLTKFRSV